VNGLSIRFLPYIDWKLCSTPNPLHCAPFLEGLSMRLDSQRAKPGILSMEML